jgi:hypothetical protein
MDGGEPPTSTAFLHRTSEELTRAVTAVGVRDDRIHSVAALIPDRKLRSGG